MRKECQMNKMYSRKETAAMLGISVSTLDNARNAGEISYVQFVPGGCVFFTDDGLNEYIASCTHRARRKPKNANGNDRRNRHE